MAAAAAQSSPETLDAGTRRLLDTLPCAWLRLGGDGTILEANTETERLAGAGPGGLRGHPFDELLSRASRVVYQTHLLPLLQLAGDCGELGLTLKTADQEPLDVLFYARHLGERRFDVLLAPIRQRRRIEDELVRVKRAADQAPMMVFQLLCDAQGPRRFPYASQSVRELYGCTPEAAAESADGVLDAFAVEARQRLVTALAEAGPRGQACRLQLPLRTQATVHELVATPRIAADGSVLWHGYATDVTERLQLEREATEREAAEESARVRKAFLARASHELRTPLNAILGFAQLLGRDGGEGLGPEQRRALGLLQTAGRHMLALVNRLLDLSRVEREGPAAPLHPLLLEPLLAEALDAMRPQAQAAGLRLCEPPPASGVAVLGDAVSLHQILANLLSNAIKYNRPGGDVRIGWSTDGADRVLVEVADTGPGLSPAQLTRLFEPFNRLGAEQSATEGTGLGLVLARQLARELEGDITVDSEPGCGSRFTLALKRAVAAAVPAPGAMPAGGPQARRGHVLYVEDNEVNVVLMQAIVALRPGVVLSTASSGAEAEALCRADAASDARGPDLLLLDLNLPDTTGHELLQRLRSVPRLARTPAILVTAAVQEVPSTDGFAERWIKPLDVDATLAALDRLLA